MARFTISRLLNPWDGRSFVFEVKIPFTHPHASHIDFKLTKLRVINQDLLAIKSVLSCKSNIERIYWDLIEDVMDFAWINKGEIL